jgi:hypothetical protein
MCKGSRHAYGQAVRAASCAPPAGKLSRKASITWSSTPAAVLADEHYVLAVQAGVVEVVPVSRLAATKVVQALEVAGLELALAAGPAQDGSLYVASGKDAGVCAGGGGCTGGVHGALDICAAVASLLLWTLPLHPFIVCEPLFMLVLCSSEQHSGRFVTLPCAMLPWRHRG